ncbi:MAG: hypothetical protein ACK5HP_00365 [Bacilli bacterium]
MKKSSCWRYYKLEKIENLFKYINKEIENRKTLFKENNGNFINYCKNSGKTLPNLVVIINNFKAFQELVGQYEEILTILSRDCNRYGVYFVITLSTTNGARFILKQNFSLTYCLQQNSEDDYIAVLGNTSRLYSSKLFGRGFIKLEDIFEFQTALVYPKDEITKFIKNYCETISISSV